MSDQAPGSHPAQKARGFIIRNIYLYVVAAIALFMIAFSVSDLVNIALKTWVFTKADQINYYAPKSIDGYCSYDKNNVKICPSPEDQAKQEAQDKKMQEDQRISQKQQDLVRNISLLIVAIPLFSYHWRLIRKDRADHLA